MLIEVGTITRGVQQKSWAVCGVSFLTKLQVLYIYIYIYNFFHEFVQVLAGKMFCNSLFTWNYVKWSNISTLPNLPICSLRAVFKIFLQLTTWLLYDIPFFGIWASNLVRVDVFLMCSFEFSRSPFYTI